MSFNLHKRRKNNYFGPRILAEKIVTKNPEENVLKIVLLPEISSRNESVNKCICVVSTVYCLKKPDFFSVENLNLKIVNLLYDIS